MNRVLLAMALVAAGFAAACSGGGSTPTPPPPTGGFSNASLSGQYVFSMSGQDAGGFFARIGVFKADGNGGISTGIEDVNSAANGVGTFVYTGGTYSISANGRGTITLTNSTGSTGFSVTLKSTTQGFIVETDGLATTSGGFYLQNANVLSTNPSSVNGPYVFDFSGIDGAGNPDSIIGQFNANGAGGLTSGLLDENDAAVASGPQGFTSASYAMDTAYGATFGRGSITFTAGGITYSYVYYVVDSTRIRLIEANSNALTLGDAVAQTTPPANNAAFSGNFAFLVGGGSGTGALARVGRFTSNGTGGLTGIALDDNVQFNPAAVPDGSISAATYAIDTVNGGGRGTLTFTDSKLGTYVYVFYMNSATQGVFQDNSAGVVADGSLQAQSVGPFTNSSVAGNYAFNWSGVSFNSSTSAEAEEDYVGQLVLSSAASSNVTGATDFNAFSSNSPPFTNIVVSGTLTIGGDGTTSSGTRNTLSATIQASPSSTINFAAYVVNSQTIFVNCTDKNKRVTAGILTLQSQ